MCGEPLRKKEKSQKKILIILHLETAFKWIKN